MRPGFRRYALIGHRRVEGWIEPPILSVVAALSEAQFSQGVHGAIAEIGVHHGRLFIGMLLAGEDREGALAVDLFADQANNVDSSGAGDEAVFRRNLQTHAPAVEVTVLGTDSTKLAVADIIDRVGPVRLFDVDGGHTADIVAHDMRTAASSIVAGGIVISDDVFNQQWPGAFEGTARYLSDEPPAVPFAIGFNKTMFTAPEYSEAYRMALQHLVQRKAWLSKDSVMYGHPVTILSVPSGRARLKTLVKTRVRR